MKKFPNWFFAEAFSAREAAMLAIGLDPVDEDSTRITPILRWMKNSYMAALYGHKDAIELRNQLEYALRHPVYVGAGRDENREFIEVMKMHNSDDLFHPQCLHSWRMESYYDVFNTPPTKDGDGIVEMVRDSFFRWVSDPDGTDFRRQLFSRKELVRWFAVYGFESEYDFSNGIATATSNHSIERAKVDTANGKGKRDLLTPIIEQAQSTCRDKWDASEVWGRLLMLARTKAAPLNGSDESGIQWLDSSESLKTLSMSALRMRLRRARESTPVHAW